MDPFLNAVVRATSSSKDIYSLVDSAVQPMCYYADHCYKYFQVVYHTISITYNLIRKIAGIMR